MFISRSIGMFKFDTKKHINTKLWSKNDDAFQRIISIKCGLYFGISIRIVACYFTRQKKPKKAALLINSLLCFGHRTNRRTWLMWKQHFPVLFVLFFSLHYIKYIGNIILMFPFSVWMTTPISTYKMLKFKIHWYLFQVKNLKLSTKPVQFVDIIYGGFFSL